MDTRSQPSAALDELREITLPDPVSYAPQTVGWWILFGVLAAALVLAALLLYRRWSRRRYRRAALLRLDDVSRRLSGPGRVAALREVPVLLKRVAMVSFGRAAVAQLCGKEWLAFLAGTWPGNAFTDEDGMLLMRVAYERDECLAEVSEGASSSLLSLARQWVRFHRTTAASGKHDA